MQSAADFYRLAYTATLQGTTLELPSLRTGDREHGGLLTTSAGLGSTWRTSDLARKGWTFSAMAEVGRTSFNEALYIDARTSMLLTMSAQTTF